MPTFTPPTENRVPTTVPYPHPGNSLMRFYSARAEGVNVWKKTDGSYTEVQPMEPSDIAITYYGAHSYEVSDDEAAALTAAGYGDYIT